MSKKNRKSVTQDARMKKSRRGRRQYNHLWWPRGKKRDGSNVAV